MTPVKFEGANTIFGPSPDLAESQVQTIHALRTVVNRGSCEGTTLVVTAWSPSVEELIQLKQGNPVFLSVLGGLPPHFITTNLADACNPA